MAGKAKRFHPKGLALFQQAQKVCMQRLLERLYGRRFQIGNDVEAQRKAYTCGAVFILIDFQAADVVGL